MRPYTQLSDVERDCIEECLKEGKSRLEIAAKLGRHLGTIYREIDRNKMAHGYSARIAHQDTRRRKSNQYALKMTPELWSKIAQELTQHSSPEQIAGRMHTENIKGVCTQTIYNHVRIKSATSKFYTLCLRRKGKKYRRKTQKHRENKGFLRIHDIPQFLLGKRKPRVWEGDLIEGKIGSGYIMTFVERFSRYTLAAKIETKRVQDFNPAARDIFAPFDNDILRAIIYDRGTEMSGYKELAEVLNCPIYFCDPGSPWQRGLDENTNGLLREWFSKGSSFKAVTQEQVDESTKLLNARPRKALNFRTPDEVFFQKPFALRFGM